MPQHLKMFEWLLYGSLAVGFVSTLLGTPLTGEFVFAVILYVIIIALVWAAARKGQVWAAWIVTILTVLGTVALIGHFWVGGPAWLQDILRPEAQPTALEKMLDVVAWIMAVAGLYFYFFGNKQAVAHR
ncbi:MAG: hypothetical protein ACRECO_16340 [Xanthobacteraceae bacterium]